jgi:hypothetical protein
MHKLRRQIGILPGLEVQAPVASLKIAAKFRVGRHPDWILISGDTVWFAPSKPNTLQRIDALTNKVISKLDLPGEACSGLAFGFDSVWVPLYAPSNLHSFG